jgi:hypothetical protein
VFWGDKEALGLDPVVPLVVIVGNVRGRFQSNVVVLDDFLLQPPLQKRHRVRTPELQDTDETVDEQPVHNNHPRPELLSQRQATREDATQRSTGEPHPSQIGAPPRQFWQPGDRIAYRDPVPDGTLPDRVFADNGQHTYVPDNHQQARGPLYQPSQQRGGCGQPDSQEYTMGGYLLNARSQDWEAAECNAANWVLASTGYAPQQGVPWRGGPSSAQMATTVYRPQPPMAPVAEPVQQGRGQQHEFQSFREPVFFDHNGVPVQLDRNGVPVQPVHQRVFYDEIERAAFDRPNVAYNNSQSVALSVPPMLTLRPTMGGPYPMAAPPQTALPASDRLDNRQHTIPPGHHIPSSESLNPDNSPTRECARAEDSVHTEQPPKNHSSARKQRRDAQHVYEAEEADRKARGQKPHAIGCDSVGLPDETGRPGSRFLEVLKSFCTIFLDLSIIKVGLQDPDDYASLRA